MEKNSRIYVAGHNGLVGSAVVRRLIEDGYEQILTVSGSGNDLRITQNAANIISDLAPEYIFLCAAKVGGIHANNAYSANFFYDNMMIQTNVIHSAYEYGVKKLLFLGSSCIYPKDCLQPIKEEYLMTGALEKTNSAYATTKIAGIEMCRAYRKQYGCNFISVMPTNLYGPNDNFSLETSHVLPAMIRKFHNAKINNDTVELWGTGSPRREFLHVDDLANGVVFLMNNYNHADHINIGAGEDISIKDLSNTIREIVGCEKEIEWNTSYPDGTPQKLLDVSKIKELGWEPKINLEEGISRTYKWFLENYDNIRK